MKHVPVRECLYVVVILGLNADINQAQEEVEGVREKKFTLEPAELAYFLIGPDGKLTTPEKRFKLLVVMPRGDGGEDFEPFIKYIYKDVLDEDYLVLQLVAPKWGENQGIVWPTARNRVKGQKASVEEFVKAAVADVEKRSRIDKRHVYTLSCSPRGPAAYAASLAKDTPVNGSLVGDVRVQGRRIAGAQAAGQEPTLLHSALAAGPSVSLSEGC